MKITPKSMTQPLCGGHPPAPVSGPEPVIVQPGGHPVPVVPPDSPISGAAGRPSQIGLGGTKMTIEQLQMKQAKQDAMAFDQKDSNDDGQISEGEYGIVPGDNDGINWQLNQQREQEFRMADADRDGQLSVQEHQAMLKEQRTLDIEPGARPPRSSVEA